MVRGKSTKTVIILIEREEVSVIITKHVYIRRLGVIVCRGDRE